MQDTRLPLLTELQPEGQGLPAHHRGLLLAGHVTAQAHPGVAGRRDGVGQARPPPPPPGGRIKQRVGTLNGTLTGRPSTAPTCSPAATEHVVSSHPPRACTTPSNRALLTKRALQKERPAMCMKRAIVVVGACTCRACLRRHRSNLNIAACKSVPTRHVRTFCCEAEGSRFAQNRILNERVGQARQPPTGPSALQSRAGEGFLFLVAPPTIKGAWLVWRRRDVCLLLRVASPHHPPPPSRFNTRTATLPCSLACHEPGQAYSRHRHVAGCSNKSTFERIGISQRRRR